MFPDEDTRLSSFELVQAILDRLSHALRSPLGVAQGVIADVKNARSISSEAATDADMALKRSLEILEMFRAMTKNYSYRCAEVSPTGLLQALAIEGDIENADDLVLVLDKELFDSALTYLRNYLAQRKGIEWKHITFHPSIREGNVFVVAASHPHVSAEMKTKLGALPQSFEHFVGSDHSFEAVGGIFASAVLRALNCKCEIQAVDSSLKLEISLPLRKKS